MYQKVLKIAKLKFCDILDLKFAIHSKKDLTNRINCHSLFLTNMYKLFLEKRFSNLKECNYFYKWNIVSYQKKIFRRQFRWIPVEMLCPILDKNLPVENEISLISFKIFDINIWSQCKKKKHFSTTWHATPGPTLDCWRCASNTWIRCFLIWLQFDL